MRISQEKIRYFIGIDEVGRGPLAGPVTLAAAVFLTRRPEIWEGIRDSKKLKAKGREEWLEKAKEQQVKFAIASATNKTIDRIGIIPAITLAIKFCLERLELPPEECLVLLDGGLKAPPQYLYQETIIRGDEQEPVIALASIIAKVNRDQRMVGYSKTYPQYNFAQHKGYGTVAHYTAIKKHGLSPLHRRSFLKSLMS